MLLDLARRAHPDLDPSLSAWLALGLAVRGPRDGHTCIDLARGRDWAAGIDFDAEAHLDWPADAEDWKKALASAGPLVGGPEDQTPFILDGDRLSIARSWHEERKIADRLTRDGSSGDGGSVAQVEVLLGGPGTGKTTEVARRLIQFFRDEPDSTIALAAPTGKAAARMAEALRQRLDASDAPPEVRDKVAAARPLTIHKLLGYRPHGTPRYRYHATSPLDVRFVIVDEASMLSSSMMLHLLEALGDKTSLLLVGDPDQLASVDAGSVLGDIARAARPEGSPLHRLTRLLTVRHRFGPRIGALADAILAGDDAGVAQTFAILERRFTITPDPRNVKPDDPESVEWVEPGSDAFKGIVKQAVAQATRLRDRATAGQAAEAVAAQAEFQVLCAHRSGTFGVGGLNVRVERQLDVTGGDLWYVGRPVLVTRNTPTLDLFNGDVGIVVPGEGGRRDAAFPREKEGIKRVPVARLEAVETVHALTIHKSQGSEYRHVVVVLPEKPSRIVTRELLYTGVTRARDKVTVVGSRAVIEAAIRKPIRRATGLAGRL
jgi:exodeoxyribonuclease V alpha subunit